MSTVTCTIKFRIPENQLLHMRMIQLAHPAAVLREALSISSGLASLGSAGRCTDDQQDSQNSDHFAKGAQTHLGVQVTRCLEHCWDTLPRIRVLLELRQHALSGLLLREVSSAPALKGSVKMPHTCSPVPATKA